MNSRSAARPMLPSSQTATNSCSDVRSMRRAKLRSEEVIRDLASRMEMESRIFLLFLVDSHRDAR